MTSTPGAVHVERIRAALGVERLELLPPHDGSVNRHLRALAADGAPALFVKVYGSAPSFEREGTCYAFLAADPERDRYLIPVAGAADPGCPWRAFRHEALFPFGPAAAGHLREAGEALGRLHRRPVADGEVPVRAYASVAASMDSKRELCRAQGIVLAPAHTAAVSRLLGMAPELEAMERGFPRVLMHGDFGFRNLARRGTADGEAVLYDFEHAATGPAPMDLAKVLDVGLEQPVDRAAFLEGYAVGAGRPLDLPDLYRDAVRGWCALGILPYAAATADTAYGAHALRILDDLAARHA
jgi:hypothetical protein